jgi:hypothetical protein
MMLAVFVTIWVAVLLFVAGESGRTFSPRGAKPPVWAWACFFVGCLIAIVHTVLAFAIVHHWNHADAVRDTARLTLEMYGVDFGAALYMNYVFLAVWLADAIWWAAAPPRYVRPAAVTWSLRGFYMLYLFNALVVFAHEWRRIVGLVLISWLARIWAPGVLQSRPLRP